jgi:hypothetical protein
MAKTNATFKFGKMNKIQLGGILDPEARRIYKNAMVDAQSSFTASKNRKFSELRSSNTPQLPKAE